jgi:hypothetical protein
MPADEDLKAIWLAYAEGRLTDEAAQAAAESVPAQRASSGGNEAVRFGHGAEMPRSRIWQAGRFQARARMGANF